MTMVKSLNHAPSVPAWTTLELDLSMVSLKTWDGLSIQRFRWRSLRSVQEIVLIGGYNPSTGDIICMGPSRDLCPTLPDGTRVVLNFSGRGDKDVQTSIKYLEV